MKLDLNKYTIESAKLINWSVSETSKQGAESIIMKSYLSLSRFNRFLKQFPERRTLGLGGIEPEYKISKL